MMARSSRAYLIAWLALVMAHVAGSGSPVGAQTPPATDVPAGAPVTVVGREVFRIREREGSLSAAERASLLSGRLDDLVTNPFRSEPEIEVVDTLSGTDILADGDVLVTVTDADALAAGMDRQELAERAAELIRAAVRDGRSAHGLRATLARIGQAALALAALIAVLLAERRLFGGLRRRVAGLFTAREPSPEARLPTWRDARLAKPVDMLLRLAQIAAMIAILVVVTTLVLAIFPRTRAIADALIRFAREPLAEIWRSFLDYLPNLGFVVVIAALAWLLVRGVQWFFAEVERGVFALPQFDAKWSRTTANLFSALVVVLAFVMAFPYLPGSDSPAFQGVGLFLGLLVSLSSTSAVANIIAGIIQTYTGSFEVGDVVRIGDTLGVVVAKRLLVTRVRTFKNEEISIPNAVVLSASVANLSLHAREDGLVVHTTVTIGYDVPWRQVHEVLLSAARDVADLSSDPAPFVLQTALNDYHVSYELNAFTTEAERLPRVYSDLHARVQDAFNAAGVEILSPAYQALRDGNESTVPAEAQPNRKPVSGFRVDLGR